MMTQVRGCVDCPLFDDGANYEYEQICKHPFAPHQFYESDKPEIKQKDIPRIEIEECGEQWSESFHYSPITPDWCPLKTEPITIYFKS